VAVVQRAADDPGGGEVEGPQAGVAGALSGGDERCGQVPRLAGVAAERRLVPVGPGLGHQDVAEAQGLAPGAALDAPVDAVGLHGLA
jgi:hypothetical protein